MKEIKRVSYRITDAEQGAMLDALSYFKGKSLQEIIDIAVLDYYLKCLKEDPKLETVKNLHKDLHKENKN